MSWDVMTATHDVLNYDTATGAEELTRKYTVPTGKRWYVDSWSWLTATAALSAKCRLYKEAACTNLIESYLDTTSTTANRVYGSRQYIANSSNANAWSEPLELPAGATFYFWLNATGAGQLMETTISYREVDAVDDDDDFDWDDIPVTITDATTTTSAGAERTAKLYTVPAGKRWRLVAWRFTPGQNRSYVMNLLKTNDYTDGHIEQTGFVETDATGINFSSRGRYGEFGALPTDHKPMVLCDNTVLEAGNSVEFEWTATGADETITSQIAYKEATR